MRPDASSEHIEEADRYLAAAEEDLGVLEYIRNDGFRYAKNACLLAAGYSEKVIKAKLLLTGIDAGWTHDQRVLLQDFPESPDIGRAMEYATILPPYATKANYPSTVSDEIDSDEAREAYKMAVEMPYLIGLYQHNA